MANNQRLRDLAASRGSAALLIPLYNLKDAEQWFLRCDDPAKCARLLRLKQKAEREFWSAVWSHRTELEREGE